VQWRFLLLGEKVIEGERQKQGEKIILPPMKPPVCGRHLLARPSGVNVVAGFIQRAQQALFFQRRQFRPALRIEPELAKPSVRGRKPGDGVLNFNQRAHGSGKLPRRSHFG